VIFRIRFLWLTALLFISCGKSWENFWETPCFRSRLENIQPANWSELQVYLQAQADKGVRADPEVYTIPGPAGSELYLGGILGTNGKIYGIPFDATSYLEIDPQTETYSQFGSAPGSTAFGSGALGPNGKIYLNGFTQTLPRILNPRISEADSAGLPASGGQHFLGSTLAPNGAIYGIPIVYSAIVKIDTATDTHTYFGALGGGTKWSGAQLAPNGRIFGMPRDITAVIEIDPSNDTTTQFGSLSAAVNKWSGSALANNGKVYGSPGSTGTILEIDPVTRQMREIGGLSATAFNYLRGVYAPNGKIYFLPHAGTQVLEFNPATLSFRHIGPVFGAGPKWSSGVLAQNGKIYGIPRSASGQILVIDTQSTGALCAPVLESAYLNRF
jgi:hypothetical protein